MPTCSECHQEGLRKSDFTASQLKKNAAVRRCRACRAKDDDAPMTTSTEAVRVATAPDLQELHNASPTSPMVNHKDQESCKDVSSTMEDSIDDEYVNTTLVQSTEFAQRALEDMLGDLHQDFLSNNDNDAVVDRQDANESAEVVSTPVMREEMDTARPAPYEEIIAVGLRASQSQDAEEESVAELAAMTEPLDKELDSAEIVSMENSVVNIDNQLPDEPLVETATELNAASYSVADTAPNYDALETGSSSHALADATQSSDKQVDMSMESFMTANMSDNELSVSVKQEAVEGLDDMREELTEPPVDDLIAHVEDDGVASEAHASLEQSAGVNMEAELEANSDPSQELMPAHSEPLTGNTTEVVSDSDIHSGPDSLETHGSGGRNMVVSDIAAREEIESKEPHVVEINGDDLINSSDDETKNVPAIELDGVHDTVTDGPEMSLDEDRQHATPNEQSSGSALESFHDPSITQALISSSDGSLPESGAALDETMESTVSTPLTDSGQESDAAVAVLDAISSLAESVTGPIIDVFKCVDTSDDSAVCATDQSIAVLPYDMESSDLTAVDLADSLADEKLISDDVSEKRLIESTLIQSQASHKTLADYLERKTEDPNINKSSPIRTDDVKAYTRVAESDDRVDPFAADDEDQWQKRTEKDLHNLDSIAPGTSDEKTRGADACAENENERLSDEVRAAEEEEINPLDRVDDAVLSNDLSSSGIGAGTASLKGDATLPVAKTPPVSPKGGKHASMPLTTPELVFPADGLQEGDVNEDADIDDSDGLTRDQDANFGELTDKTLKPSHPITLDESDGFAAASKDEGARLANIDERRDQLIRPAMTDASFFTPDTLEATDAHEVHSHQQVDESTSSAVSPLLKPTDSAGRTRKLNAYIDATSKPVAADGRSSAKPIPLHTGTSNLKLMYLSAATGKADEPKPIARTANLEVDIAAQRQKYNDAVFRKRESIKRSDKLALGGIAKSKEAYLARATRDSGYVGVPMPTRVPVLDREWKGQRQMSNSDVSKDEAATSNINDLNGDFERQSSPSIIIATEDQEEIARRKIEEKASFEAHLEERAQIELQARRKAEDGDRRVQEERDRLAAAARARREAEEKERREAEEENRLIKEERARIDAEERARHEARMKERRKAEEEELRSTEKARQQAADEMKRIAAEKRAHFEAEEQQRREAEKDREVKRLLVEIAAIENKLTGKKVASERSMGMREEARHQAADELSRIAAEKRAHFEAEERLRREAEKDREANRLLDEIAAIENKLTGLKEASESSMGMRETSNIRRNGVSRAQMDPLAAVDVATPFSSGIIDDDVTGIVTAANKSVNDYKYGVIDEQDSSAKATDEGTDARDMCVLVDDEAEDEEAGEGEITKNYAPSGETEDDTNFVNGRIDPIEDDKDGVSSADGYWMDALSGDKDTVADEAMLVNDNEAPLEAENWVDASFESDSPDELLATIPIAGAPFSAQSSVSTEITSNVMRQNVGSAGLLHDDLSVDSECEFGDTLQEPTEYLKLKKDRLWEQESAAADLLPIHVGQVTPFSVPEEIFPFETNYGNCSSPSPSGIDATERASSTHRSLGENPFHDTAPDQEPTEDTRDIESGFGPEPIPTVGVTASDINPQQKAELNFCSRRSIVLLVILLALIALTIGLLVGLAKRQTDTTTTNLAGASTVPSRRPLRSPLSTLPPTTVSDVNSFRESLPDYTIVAISKSGSPQQLAFDWITSNPSFAQYSAQQRMSRFALTTFYFATNGDGWLNNKGWLTEENECRWYTEAPSSCINNDFTYLQLGDNNLSGTIPEEIGLLSTLLTIQAAGNKELKGTLPSTIANLPQLYWLILNGNGLSGSVPSSLGSLPSLLILDLEQNSFQGSIPVDLGSLSILDKLFLNENILSGSVPSELADLTALRYFDLGQNKLTGTVPNALLKRMDQLVHFSVEQNELTGALARKQLWKNLAVAETIHIGSNQLTGTIPGKLLSKSLEQIVDLDLSDNLLSGTIPSELGLLPDTLGNLSLGGNSLSGSVPPEVCQLIVQRGVVLTVDCDKIQCGCGCACAL